MSEFWQRYRRNKGAIVGLALLAMVVLLALAAPLVFPASPWEMTGPPFQRPLGDFLLGTDMLGREILSGIVHGARVSLMVGVVSTVVAVSLGIAIGALAG